MSKKFPIKVPVHMQVNDIEEAECGDPNKCAIKLAVKRALKMAHGYIHVDASGVAITRRPDYREKADLPRRMRQWMLDFDRHLKLGLPAPKPTSFILHFRKTTRIEKRDLERIYAARRQRAAEGRPDRTYNIARRVDGIATTKHEPDVAL